MSKKLDSILSKVPNATASPSPLPITDVVIENDEIKSVATKASPPERIVANIPYSLKHQIRKYLVEHPEDNERTLILRGLKNLGFNISEDEIKDKRGLKSK